MNRKFLLATDGTETSKVSEDYIAELLSPEETTIHLLKVIDLFDEDKLSEISLGIDLEELQKRHEKKAEDILEPRADTLETLGFDTETEFVHGNPGEEICKRADELDANGIFIGRGKHSRLGEMFYGSVSHHVILNASCSVIVTPTSE